VEELTGWIDYDRPHLSRLGPGERLDYFERRVRFVAISPLGRLIETEIHVPESSALLICGVSLCCAIEATGRFLCGGKGTRAHLFGAFLERYMSPKFKSKTVGNTTFGCYLWRHYRNGLAHGFTVAHGGFEGNRGQPYFVCKPIQGRDCLMVNPYRLYDDYSAGFSRYVLDLRSARCEDPLRVDFDDVFDQVFIQGK